jgi:hypothetical protein
MAEGIDLSEDAQALDAIREVGPGSHYLGCAHTQANFQTAFYRSALADNNSFEQWEIEGEKRVEQRANALARSWLEHYERRRSMPRSTKPFSTSSPRRRIRCPTPSLEREPEQAREQGGAAQVADFIQNEVWRPHYDRQGPKPK